MRAASITAGLLLAGSLVACGRGAGDPDAAPLPEPTAPSPGRSPSAERPVAGTPAPVDMSELGYFTIGELTTSTGEPVRFLAILAEDAAAFGLGGPDDDLCVGVGSLEEGGFGGGCQPRPTAPPDGFGASEEGSDLCVHVVTAPGGSAAVQAGDTRVPLVRLPGSDRLGADVLAACFESPPGGIDDVELVRDGSSG